MDEHVLLVELLTFVAGLFVRNNVLWRWGNLLYAAQLSSCSRGVSEVWSFIVHEAEIFRFNYFMRSH